MRALPLRPRTFRQVRGESQPSLPGAPEQIPQVFYDTQLYTSGTTTQMQFFAVTNADRTISNMVNAGQFPHPVYFQWFNWGLDILIDNSTVTAANDTGAVDDIAKLLLISRATVEFTISDKSYGRIPLSFLHSSLEVKGFGYGTFAAPVSVQLGATNGPADGGWNWNGAIIIPPNTGFTMTVNFAAAQTLQFGNTNLKMWMLGLVDRKVL